MYTAEVLVLLTVIVQSKAAVVISPFILGGSNTKIGEFPFVVSLQFISGDDDWLHYCAGTVLNENWILTAAMCVYEDDLTQNRIQYGTNEISSRSDAPNVAYFDRLLWHEDFNINTLFNDIGLIKTQSRMEIEHFNYKVKLPISSAYFSTGTMAVIAGMVQYEIIKQIHHHDNPIKVSVEMGLTCR